MSSAPALIVGNYLSPYVRKVLVVLEEKGIPYDVDPLIPFYGDDRFSALSPLRRIPVLVDGDVTLTDSTVICEYLEDRYPEPALRPRDIAARARARWLEEFADSRMGDVIIWRFYNQLVIRRFVWGQAADREVVDKAREQEIPTILDYIEAQIGDAEFLCGDFSVADVSIATFFRNAGFARYAIDPERWPRAAALVGRVLARDSFRKLAAFEERCLKVPIPEHRAALVEMGAPIAATTLISAEPRASLMGV